MSKSLKEIILSPVSVSDLELIAVGALSPLTGFMGQADYRSVVHDMHLANGLPWTIPVTLPVDASEAESIQIGQSVALAEPAPDGSTHLMGVLEVSDKFTYNKEEEASLVYRTTEVAHPGVARLYAQGDTLLAGEIWVFELPLAAQTEFPELRHTPAQTRRMFARTRLAADRGASRRATPSTARTSTSRRRRWRSSTACSSTRWWARPSPTTSPPTCACELPGYPATTTTRRTA